ncbi:MAG: hypothetical protein ACXV8G_07175 [Acidimicrobiales bacterium]
MNRAVFRRAAATVVLALTVLSASAFTLSTPAGAATTKAGYRYYQLDGVGCNDAALYVDAYGRIPYAYFDLNRDCYYETLARDVDLNGELDEAWHDSTPGGNWEHLVTGNMLWTGPNQFNYSGSCIDGPYGICWKSSGLISTTIGGISSYGGWNSAAAFNNLMVAMARQTGISIWKTGQI